MTSPFDTNRTFTALEALEIIRDEDFDWNHFAWTWNAVSEALDVYFEDDVLPLETPIPAVVLDDEIVPFALVYDIARSFGKTARDARCTITFTNGTRWVIDRWPGGGFQWSYGREGADLEQVADSLRIMLKVAGMVGEDERYDPAPLDPDEAARLVDAGVLEVYEEGSVRMLDTFLNHVPDSAPSDLKFTSIEFSTPAQRSF